MSDDLTVTIFWFRRDLRLDDNTALWHALSEGHPVVPIFIFDQAIIDELPRDDPRVNFIYESLRELHRKLETMGSGLMVKDGKPEMVWKELLNQYAIASVYANRDYEPYAINRDSTIGDLLSGQGIPFHLFKDHVIFEPGEILKPDGKPYTIYTPYMKRWMQKLEPGHTESLNTGSLTGNFLHPMEVDFPPLESLGFKTSSIIVEACDLGTDRVHSYDRTRDYPGIRGTTRMGPHLRFGTLSIREAARVAKEHNEVLLKELVWREFFMQILYYFPAVIDRAFKPAYDFISWRNDEEEFHLWCRGKTGYPLVDAGMRELNETGYMHNRVRMVVASFLSKHLLIDWRRGEAYFAEKLLDYELASNNGNWQWAAGTGCDAAPYFRVFNPTLQQEKYDPHRVYIARWIPELQSANYVPPMVDHEFARHRALEYYRKALQEK